MLNIYPTVQESRINHLIEFLEEYDNWQAPHHYTIIEWISDNDEPCTYELYNLTMELVQGIVICSDADEILWDNQYALHSFLADNVDMIQYHSDGNYITIVLVGESYDGFIRIYY